MQFKLCSLVLLAATLVNCAPADSSKRGLSRRDLVGDINAVSNQIQQIRNEIDSAVIGTIGGWSGGAADAARNTLQSVDNDLTSAASALNSLSQALAPGCDTYQNCDSSVPF